ncbi:hypothetical protein Pelo_17583 [Pelomyxa schiedti]|nr:hypothetical protein Pelo_17583 [Pelomyxa schiedti]
MEVVVWGRDQLVAFGGGVIDRSVPLVSARRKVHLFMGLSATLGVVWCRVWSGSDNEVMGPADCWTVVQTVGDERFLVTNSSVGEDGTYVVDSSGGVVAQLGLLEGLVPGSDIWVSNRKWLVGADVPSWEGSLLRVWRMSKGIPVGAGVCVTCTVRITGTRFSPCSPDSDELAVVGQSSTGCGCLSFVDLDKSVESGVSVVTRKYLLPQSDPFDLVWISPDTILTMHMGKLHNSVYNTKTCEWHVFPSTSGGGCLAPIPPSHISVNPRPGSTATGVYRATDLIHPVCFWDGQITCSDCRIYATTGSGTTEAPMDVQTSMLLVSVHDAITGLKIGRLTVTLPSILGC